MGFEAPVSYENTWEGLKVVGGVGGDGREEGLKVAGPGRGGRLHGSNTLIPTQGDVLTGICSD